MISCARNITYPYFIFGIRKLCLFTLMLFFYLEKEEFEVIALEILRNSMHCLPFIRGLKLNKCFSHILDALLFASLDSGSMLTILSRPTQSGQTWLRKRS